MGVIYCIGESLKERDDDKSEQKLAEQLETLKASLGDNWSNVVIAYEPCWAFGTGKIASSD